MSTPPSGAADLARRGLRGLAVGAVLLAVAATAAVADGRQGTEPLVLATAAAALLGAGAARAAAGRWRSASATSAVVAGVVLATLAARSWLRVDVGELSGFLTGAGGLALVAGLVTDERRLAALGVGQWAAALAIPPSGAAVLRHCLVATDLGVPVPRLDGPLVLAVGALAAGTALRWSGRRLQAGRGVEATGMLLLLGTLLAKGIELPGLPALCGTGDAVDAGWLALALVAGVLATAYGIGTDDALWAAAGTATVVLAGLAGTGLGAGAWWAVVALVPVAGAIGWSEARGVPWPSDPGYGRRLPRAGQRARGAP